MKQILLILSVLLLFNLPLAALAVTVQLPQTGQTTCYDSSGATISCTGTGQDGATLTGAAWPSPRFVDNSNGTITDNLTGLIWLKNANCTDTIGGITGGVNIWPDALTWSNSLASGSCGLSDGSIAGQWRLPNRKELQSLLNQGQSNNFSWLDGQGFSNVQTNLYWTSTTYAANTGYAWSIGMIDNTVFNGTVKSISTCSILPVRSGQ